jgi:hypothetical protein
MLATPCRSPLGGNEEEKKGIFKTPAGMEHRGWFGVYLDEDRKHQTNAKAGCVLLFQDVSSVRHLERPQMVRVYEKRLMKGLKDLFYCQPHSFTFKYLYMM